MMGCREGVDTDEHSPPCQADELPYREVTLDAFWIDKTEVTKGAYRKCMAAGSCEAPYLWDREWYDDLNDDDEKTSVWKPGSDDMPAASVNWLQAKTYCE